MSVTGSKGSAGSNAMHSSLIHTLKVTKWLHKYQLNFPQLKSYRSWGSTDTRARTLLSDAEDRTQWSKSHRWRINQTRRLQKRNGHRKK